MSLIVVGDIHLMNDCDNHIKHEQSKKFMNWFKEQEFNNFDNRLVLLGDVAEYNINYETQRELINWFDSLHFNKIFWVQGNHCCTSSDSLLNIFKDYEHIEIIIRPFSYFDMSFGKHLLFLPHYDYENSSYEKMEISYSNLYKDEDFNVEFDYGFGHITDYTQSFGGGEICDTSKLKVKNWLNGHVHAFDKDKGGNYLGSAVKNSSTEKGTKKYIAKIDDTCEYIEIPTFMEYYACEYGEFPKVDTELALFQINNAPTKYDAEKLYKEHYKDIEIGFTKTLTKRNNVMNSESIIDTVDDNELFEQFAKEKNLSNSVIDICKKVL